ncbi:MAG: hypothetical protein R2697_10600 [Ilumatobacteraceae bacterium]
MIYSSASTPRAPITGDPATLTRTVDVVIDPLDLAGARTRSIEVLALVAEQGIDEVRCWLHADATASQRAEALDAYLDLRSKLEGSETFGRSRRNVSDPYM